MKRYSLVFGVLVMGFVTFFLGRSSDYFKPMESTVEKKPLYWIDSMEPTIHYPKSGQSRMGMQLIPVYPEDVQGDSQSTIRISPTVVNNLGVRTAPVIKGSLARPIETVGYVEPNENNISHIHTYANGWIKKLYVKAVGEVVQQGQIIAKLYSPTLVNAQEEYLIALASKNEMLIEASYKKLQNYHISEQQIGQLKTKRKSSHLIDIYPHQKGVVSMLNVREGMYVTSETEMMSIVDLSSVWMISQVFEDQANWVKTGEEAKARLTAYPGMVWKGSVDYIYPEVDPKTRTLKVRFCFTNTDLKLKPNMYATISLLVEPKQNVLSMPLEALIRSSEGDRVILSLDKGRFQSRLITIGIVSGDSVEILSGLSVGEQVVISGQFLLDSEVNLKSGLERLQTPTQKTDTKTKDGL